MKNLACALSLVAATAFASAMVGCGSDDPPYEISDFAQDMAESYCAWAYGDATLKQTACCDGAEQGVLAGAGSQAACVTETAAMYQQVFRKVQPEVWNGDAARACVHKVANLATTCERNFMMTMSSMVRNECGLVTSTKKPGDTCNDDWDCSTAFCKSGVCANPIPAGDPCVAGDICAENAICVNDVCKALQVDGAACGSGSECISGACGGGKCVNSQTYTCDGK